MDEGIMPRAAESELRRFQKDDPTLFGCSAPHRGQHLPHGEGEERDKSADSRCEEGDLNPHGFYPTSPSN